MIFFINQSFISSCATSENDNIFFLFSHLLTTWSYILFSFCLTMLLKLLAFGYVSIISLPIVINDVKQIQCDTVDFYCILLFILKLKDRAYAKNILNLHKTTKSFFCCSIVDFKTKYSSRTFTTASFLYIRRE